MNNIIALCESLFLFFTSLFLLYLPISKKYSKITLIVALVFALTAGFWRDKKRFLNWPVIIFLSGVIASVIFSFNFFHSQSVFISRYLYYVIILFIGICLSKSKKSILYIIGIILIGAIITTFGGIRDYLFSYNARLIYSFKRIIPFPSLLAIYVPLSAAVIIFARNNFLKVLAYISLVMSFICLIWNASRLAFAGVFLPVISMFFTKKRTVIAACFILIFISGGLFMPFQKKSIYARFTMDSMGDRKELWKAAVKIFKNFPIVGAGLGMYENLLYEYGPKDGYSEGRIHLHAHNTYLELLAENGIIGMLSFILMLFIFFRDTFVFLKLNSERDIQAVLIGLTASIAASLILGFGTATILVDFQTAALFWFCLGLAWGITQGELQ